MGGRFMAIVDELDMNHPKWSAPDDEPDGSKPMSKQDNPLTRDYSELNSAEDAEFAEFGGMSAEDAEFGEYICGGISAEDAEFLECSGGMSAEDAELQEYEQEQEQEAHPFAGWSESQIRLYRKHAPPDELELIDAKIARFELMALE